jgi:hypothetical protein
MAEPLDPDNSTIEKPTRDSSDSRGVFSSDASLQQPDQQVVPVLPLDGSQRGVSEPYAMMPPTSPAFVPSAPMQQEVFYSPGGNPHHRDIALDSIDVSDRPLPIQDQMLSSSHHTDIELDSFDVFNRPPPVQDRLLASLLKPMSLQDIHSGDDTATELVQQPSTFSGLGFSVRTVESNAINSINTFQTMQTMISSDTIPSNTNEMLYVDSNQQRLTLVADTTNVETSQLSLFTAAEPMLSNIQHSGAQDDHMSVDSFRQAIDGMSFSCISQNMQTPSIYKMTM